MEEGAVVGFPYCVGGGPPFLGLDNWVFTAVPLNICGDSYVDFDEECDDGNNVDNDGCLSNCTIEFAYRCNTTTSGTSVCIGNECGDGQVFEPEEECDDSNTDVQDGCSDTCVVEPGYQCQTLSMGTSLCINLCSNGVLDSDFEECDNGIGVIRDGCSDTHCQVLHLWMCQSGFNQTSHCEHVTVDFDKSNGSTLGLTVYHTTGDDVYITDPSLLDANSFNNTVLHTAIVMIILIVINMGALRTGPLSISTSLV
jgi:cysteine-rich repeat protein